MRRRGALAAAICAAALAAPVALLPAGAAPSRSQSFFRAQVLADAGTSDEIVDLLRHGGFVDRRTAFDDLTGDGKQDAVVRVSGGGAAGIVAVYIFSTDGRRPSDELRVVFRRQRLVRASTRIDRHRLVLRSRSYAAGDEPCCPSAGERATIAWDDGTGRFRATTPQQRR